MKEVIGLYKMEGARFLKHSFAYFIGSFLSKLALFFMLPIYTARIPAGDMGVYEAVTAFAVLLSSVVFFDVGVGVLRFSSAGTDEKEKGKILSSGLFLIACFSFVYLVLGGVIFGVLCLPGFPLVLLYGLCNALLAALGLVARAAGCIRLYAASGVVSTLVQIVLNLALILGAGLGVESLYISYAAGAAVGVLLLLLGSKNVWRLGKPDPSSVRRILRFCLPLGISAASYWVLTSFGRVAVTLWVDEATGGAFGISLKFAQIVVFASFAFRLAWQELAFAKGEMPDAVGERGRYYSDRTDLFVRIVFAVCFLLIPLSRVALELFPGFIAADYAAAGDLIPVALVGAALTVFCDFLEPMFGAAAQTGKLFLTTALGALSNVILIWCLIPACGAFGGHLALIFAVTVTVSVRLLLLYRIVRLKLRVRYLLFLPLLAFALFVYLRLSVFVNLMLAIGADLLGAALLLPELRVALRQIKRAKA